MDSFALAVTTALWLGILTSISPCPLATNIVAVSFIGKDLGKTSRVVLSGLSYAVGRMVVYVGLSVLIVAGILSIPSLAMFLQKYMSRLLGPLLILTGVFLLGLIRFTLPGIAVSQGMQERAARGGIWGSGLLGMIFSLSFCPVSAALFFGSLIPLSVRNQSQFLLPSLYGMGTGLPVIAFAILAAFGARSVAAAFNRLTKFEWWVRRATAVIFILVGAHYSLMYIFGINW